MKFFLKLFCWRFREMLSRVCEYGLSVFAGLRMALFRTAAIASLARKIDLNALLDYFIPVNIQVQPEAHRRARMFMLSHVFGPFLGNVIPLYLHFILNIRMDYRFWVFFASIMVFWIYPFILRRTQRYQLLAFVSIQNLIFCILWACYSYGGVYSPFLPWALIIPLLAFFYLPATGMVRNVILAQIALNLAIFAALVINHFPFPQVDLRDFEVIGIVSTLSASAYVIMMALYFANIFRDQRAFERELASLVATSDHMIALTAAAQQATIAKADFVASMSHELRTPLNAVIGYSQILLEDADEEGEKEFASDVQRIHDAGGNLLRLIDNILDFSKLEAGKMVCRPTSGNLGAWLPSVCGEMLTGATGEPCIVDYEVGKNDGAFDRSLTVDWHSLRKAFQHLVYGVAHQSDCRNLRVVATISAADDIVIRVFDPKPNSVSGDSENLFAIFSDNSDMSATKYGSVGIAFALGLKFAKLIGGDITIRTDDEGYREFIMTVPASQDNISAAA